MPKHVTWREHRLNFSEEDLRRALEALPGVPKIPEGAYIELYPSSERAVSVSWEEREEEEPDASGN